MSIEKMRAEFEEWLVVFLSDADIEDIAGARAVDTDGSTVYCFPDDDEATMGITAMWLGWQASRATLVIDVPDENDDRFWSLLDEPTADGNSHIFLEGTFTDAVHEAIEAAGVQVKP